MATDNDAALVLFSGGQDSTTCLAWALDRFALVEGYWRFEGRHMIVDLVGDLSHHLLFAYPG